MCKKRMDKSAIISFKMVTGAGINNFFVEFKFSGL